MVSHNINLGNMNPMFVRIPSQLHLHWNSRLLSSCAPVFSTGKTQASQTAPLKPELMPGFLPTDCFLPIFSILGLPSAIHPVTLTRNPQVPSPLKYNQCLSLAQFLRLFKIYPLVCLNSFGSAGFPEWLQHPPNWLSCMEPFRLWPRSTTPLSVIWRATDKIIPLLKTLQ